MIRHGNAQLPCGVWLGARKQSMQVGDTLNSRLARRPHTPTITALVPHIFPLLNCTTGKYGYIINKGDLVAFP